MNHPRPDWQEIDGMGDLTSAGEMLADELEGYLLAMGTTYSDDNMARFVVKWMVTLDPWAFGAVVTVRSPEVSP